MQGEPCPAMAVVIGGDLRKIDVIRAFWQLAIAVLEDEPSALWLNLTSVSDADTKLAACIVAILRRSNEHNTHVNIVGSQAVQDILNLCKVPPLRYFTSTNKVA